MTSMRTCGYIGWMILMGAIATGQEREAEVPRDFESRDVPLPSTVIPGSDAGNGEEPRQVASNQELGRELAEEMEILRELIHRQIVGLHAHPPHAVADLGISTSHDRATVFATHQCIDCHTTTSFVLRDGPSGFEATGSRTWTTRAGDRLGSVLGTHAPGYGLIYQLEAPPVSTAGKKEPAGGVETEPLSPWERVRRQLRGDLTRPARPPSQLRTVPDGEAASDDGPSRLTLQMLTDALLAVLGENGRHVKQLGDDDRITVAISFREPARRAPKTSALRPLGPDLARKAGNTLETPFTRSPLAHAPQLPRPGQSPHSDELGREAGTLARAGEMYMRTGEHAKAVEAYEKAFQRTLGRHWQELAVFDRRNLSDAHRELLRALLHAKVTANDMESTFQLLQSLIDLPSAPDPAAETYDIQPRVPVPSQLVVTVRKKDCVALAAGKMTAEQFRQNATVRYWDAGT